MADLGIGGAVVNRAALDPAREDVVLPGTFIDDLLPPVIFLHRRFAQDQALLGRLPIDARLIAAEQCLVILLEIVAEQREAEAPLALKRAVARAAGAADFAH